MNIETGIKGREQAEILLIDFEHGYMDVRDPVDGACRIPLDKEYQTVPTTLEITTCAKAALKDIAERAVKG